MSNSITSTKSLRFQEYYAGRALLKLLVEKHQDAIDDERLYNGGKNAAVKVGEHFAESSVWGKAGVGFLEGISEDVN